MDLLAEPRTAARAPGGADAATIVPAGRGARLTIGRDSVDLHPLWLRERSTEPGHVEPANGQRLFEPTHIALDLAVVDVTVDGDRVVVAFTDGHVSHLDLQRLAVDAGLRADEERPPDPTPWYHPPAELPAVRWERVADGDAPSVRHALQSYFRFGFFLIRGAPTAPGSLRDIAGRFGRVSATNFGELFDVRSVPHPVDLAYSPVGLSAHTDQPYRRPVPGLQFLHALVNDAPGGDSTVVDGLAAIRALADADPEAFAVLSTTDVEFRYDIGRDVVVGRAPMIELDHQGRLRCFRFSTRLDFAPALPFDALDAYYRGRRWLAGFLDDPAHRAEFRLAAGDVLVVDNHRVLHGRMPYDPSSGHRHLQGCYIDHDGPDTMWRLAVRRSA